MKLYGIALGLAAAILAGTPASAHHSKTFFDMTRTVYVSGTAKAFKWSSPHGWLDVLVPDPKGGEPTLYSIECGAPTVLTRTGWTKDSIVPGDKIKVGFHPLKNGRPGGDVASVEFPDGKKLIVDWVALDPSYAAVRPNH